SQPYIKDAKTFQWAGPIRAASLVKLGKAGEAEKLFRKALESAEAGYVLIVVQQMQVAYGTDGCVAKLQSWQAGQENNWRLQLVLGVAYSEAGKLPEAIAALLKARALAGAPLAKFLANRHLGATYYRMGKFAETEKSYLACLEVRADDVQVLNNLAYLYTNDLDKPKQALQFAAKAARLLPTDARVLDTYGWTLARVGQYAQAEQVLVRAVQLESPLAASRYHLGWVYEKTGRLDEALKQYRQGFEMLRTRKDDRLYLPLKQAVERLRPKVEKGSPT
ncbi:MAG: tetratricopeptide repeat protein, partial [Planctomycetes bacterium]|nr:tetratricopeptide repeat protein [Planctomycetota bacterium]